MPLAGTAVPVAGPPLLAARVSALASSAIRDLLRDAQRPGMLSLAGGLPAPELFDVDGLRQASERVMRAAPQEALQYGVTDGQPSLRRALSALLAGRGITAVEDQIVVTTGSQQAIDLIARAVVDPRDPVAIERPSYLAALQAFALSQADFVTIPVDAEGACIEELFEGRIKPRLVYLVTNFGNPTGATLSLQRRLKLLRWAVEHRVLVIEDDPYGELRVSGQAEPSLRALAADIDGAEQWVGYISTLSKIVSPGLRIGFAVLPGWLREAVIRVKQALDLHTSTLTQEVAAAYLETNRLQERLPRMRESYGNKLTALSEALHRTFGDRLAFNQPQGGMFLWARFADGTDTTRLLPLAREQGMIFVPGAAFFHERPDLCSLRLSFATATPAELDAATQRMAAAVEELRRTS